ncbi:MAG: DUF2868 domain-containing protein [Desulforhopalus sp.]
MNRTWRYRHIIDMEYLLQCDSQLDNSQLHQRDRNIFLENSEDRTERDQPSRKELLRLWLATRMRQVFPGPEKRSPGTIFEDSLLFGGTAALVTGLLTGAAAGLTFFTYTGKTPVNVFHFLFFFVFSQLTLIALLIGTHFLRRALPALRLPSFYTLLFKAIIGRGTRFVQKKWPMPPGADRQHSLAHTIGLLRAHGATYGSLFYWPGFCIAQLLGIGFNLALLAVTLLKVSTSDLAFGWQSTLQISGAAIHQAVEVLAFPWSWFIPQSYSYPSLEQIEGSRIILKEGIYHLATGDLVAWWPFLVFCLLFYGLLMRFCLLLAGKFFQHRTLQRIAFDTPAYISLTQRMVTPTLSTQAQPEGPANHDLTTPLRYHQPAAPPSPSFLHPLVALIPDDIFTSCPIDALRNLLQERGHDLLAAHRFMVSYEEDRKLTKLLAERTWHDNEGIFVLMEGWMPPLVDFLTLLTEWRRMLPKNAIIFIGLVGRPGSTALTPVAQQDFTVWRQKVEAIGDPYINIFPLLS